MFNNTCKSGLNADWALCKARLIIYYIRPKLGRPKGLLGEPSAENVEGFRDESGNWAVSSEESLRLLLDAHFPLNPSKEEERYTASDRGLLTLLNRSSLQDPTALYLHSFSVQQRYHAVDCHIYANCVRLGHIPATWRQVRVAFRNLGAGKSSYDTVKALDLSVSPSFYWKF